MREFLFRGKRTDNGEWIKGGIYVQKADDVKDETVYIIGGSLNDVGCAYPVEPESVGQYTGLTDKKGKKIFAGDIIKFHKYRGEPNWVGIVEYEYCLYVAKGEMPLSYEKPRDGDAIRGKFETQLSSIDTSTIEVIGNIHDNSELLKEGVE